MSTGTVHFLCKKTVNKPLTFAIQEQAFAYQTSSVNAYFLYSLPLSSSPQLLFSSLGLFITPAGPSCLTGNSQLALTKGKNFNPSFCSQPLDTMMGLTFCCGVVNVKAKKYVSNLKYCITGF